MGVPVAMNDVYNVRVACVASDQLGLNDLAFKVTALTPPFDSGIMAGLLDNLFSPVYVPLLSAQAYYYGLQSVRVLPTRAQPDETITGLPGTGGPLLGPRQAAAIVTKRTALGGRAGRGRIYVPFLPTLLIANGHLEPVAGLPALQALAAVLFNPIVLTAHGVGATLAPLLNSPANLAGNPIVGYVARTRLATQKRRGDYGKPNTLPW